MEATLCKSCRKTLNRFHLKRKTKPRYYYSYTGKLRVNHSDFRSFRNAVFEGCFICCLLWADIQRDGRMDSFENADNFTSSLWLHGTEIDQTPYETLNYAADATKGILDDARSNYSGARASVHMPLEPLGLLGNKGFWPFSNTLKCQFKRFARSSESHSVQQRPTEICDAISSGLHLHGQRWIRECLDNHKSCQQNHEERSWAPERLIRVQEKGEMEHYKLRLITTLAMPADGRYTTLSHRWSSQSFLKLTRNNFQRLSSGFVSSDLPQTFRDAVSATYLLGFHYLWIDSLCIIQDDFDDWVRQSAQMHQIYASAVCNLAASWAEDCTKPMFSQRPDSSKLADTIELRARMRYKKMRLVDEKIWCRCIEDSPLRKRGWVFQERFLSPRKMHFCEDQILWECRELHASENWQLGFWPSCLLPPAEQTDTPVVSSLYFPPGLELSLTQLSSFEKWGEIVKTYSATSLTKDTDRLVALSGVAGAFAASRGCEASAYVAGMWRDTLELSMFWVVDGPAERWKQLSSRHYIAPSFSWTSILRRISFAWDEPGIRVPNPNFRTSDVHLRYGSADRFGILLEGSHLIVTGPVWTVQWHFLDSPDVVFIARATLRVGKLREIHAKIHLDHRAWSAFNEDLFCISGGDDHDDTLSESTISSGPWTPTVLILLRPMPKHGVGAFRRIGLATDLRKDEDRYSARISLTHSDVDASGIPSVEYRPDTGEHVIKIF